MPKNFNAAPSATNPEAPAPLVDPETAETEPTPSREQYRGLGDAALAETAEAPAVQEASKPTPEAAEVSEFGPGGWRRLPENVEADRCPMLEAEYSSAELAANPLLRFNVNPDKFPILRDQATAVQLSSASQSGSRRGGLNNLPIETLNINETLGRMVTATADTVAVLAGEDGPNAARADAVIYLDKSARPVSWLVDEFWDDFTSQPRPERTSYLAIDRMFWFNAVGLKVTPDGNLAEPGFLKDAGERATFADFHKKALENPIPRSDFARARLALIPGGTDTLRASLSPEEQEKFDAYDPTVGEGVGSAAPLLPDWLVDRIFALPTGLEGKNVTIVDEVEHSGATVDIAKYIVSEAIASPATNVNSHVFWNDGVARILDNGAVQKGTSPVWYDHDANKELGKGVGDIRLDSLEQDYRDNPNADTLTRLYAAPFTGRRLDLSAQEGESSVELAREFKRMAELYRTGHVLMVSPEKYNTNKFVEQNEALGVIFTPDPREPKSFLNIRKHFIANRPKE